MPPPCAHRSRLAPDQPHLSSSPSSPSLTCLDPAKPSARVAAAAAAPWRWFLPPSSSEGGHPLLPRRRAVIAPAVLLFLYCVYCIAVALSQPQLAIPQEHADHLLLMRQHDWMTSEQHSKVAPLWEIANRVALNGTLIMAMSNAGYEDMLENFILHLDTHGLAEHLIIFASDPGIHAFAEDKWPGHSILLSLPNQFSEAPVGNISDSHEFGTTAFHQISSHRAVYMHYLLSFGFNVAYSDIDTAWVKNPMPFFTSSSSSPGGSDDGATFEWFGTMDFLVWEPHNVTRPLEVYSAHGGRVYICAGFLFLRSTPGTRALVGNWAYRLAYSGIEGGLDQDQLAEVVKWMSKYNMLPRVGVLPPLQFPSGQMMKLKWEMFESVRDEIVVFHGNYVRGHDAKVELFKSAGFWKVGEGTMHAGPRTR